MSHCATEHTAFHDARQNHTQTQHDAFSALTSWQVYDVSSDADIKDESSFVLQSTVSSVKWLLQWRRQVLIRTSLYPSLRLWFSLDPWQISTQCQALSYIQTYYQLLIAEFSELCFIPIHIIVNCCRIAWATGTEFSVILDCNKYP